MAIFRKVHVSFWSDPFVESLDTMQKLFFIYLLTNTKTKQCGIYEITKKQISFDLGCTIDTVDKHLKFFTDKGKILYSEKTNEVALSNWAKYNYSTSPKVIKCIESELKDVKDRVLIQYINGMYTVSQEEQEEEQEEEQPKSKKIDFDFDVYLKFINETLGRQLRVVDDKAKKQIQDRLKEGFTKNQIKNAIQNVKHVKTHIDSNFRHCTPEFFGRVKTLNQYGDKPKNEMTGNKEYHLHD